MEHWLDPAALAIVLGGTVLATLLRCGPAEVALALRKVGGLVRPAFDPARAKADLSQQIRNIGRDGLLGAELVTIDDTEFDGLAGALIARRSLDGLHAEHEAHARARAEAAETATRVLGDAAELAPVLGLAGTLVALGTMPADANDTGMTGAIAMAVVTTLYGIAAANFLFGPLAAAIARRAAGEERARQELLDWLENAVARNVAPAPRRPRVVAENPLAPEGLRKAS
ncbi:hypothetical protein TMRO357_02093 [Alteriqipengyuania sp. 357]